MKNETRFDIIEEMKLARLEHHQDIKKQLNKKLKIQFKLQILYRIF